jgi:hypothetical protein
MNEINIEYPPLTYWTLADVCVEPGIDRGVIAWPTVRLGATLQLLTAKGILSARNTVTYSDSGGVQISDKDYWGRYINYYNVLISKYEKAVVNTKRSFNSSMAFGGTRSPMDTWLY